MRTTRLLATGAILLAMALSACGGSSSAIGQQAAASAVPSVAPTTVPFPSVQMPADLRGVWTANVQREGPSSGVWRLRITDQTMELKNPNAASDADYFWLWTDRIDGTTFHMTADADCGEATYQWVVTGDQLALTTSDDTCGDRTVILTTPWKRGS